MFNYDEIPPFDKPLPYHLKAHEVGWDEIANATDRILLYTAPNGEPSARFDHLGDGAYANLVVIFSQPHNKPLLELFKYAVQGADLVKAEKKKSFARAIKTGEVIKSVYPKENNLGNMYTRRAAKEEWKEEEPERPRLKADLKPKKVSMDESLKQSSLDFEDPPF